MSYAITLEDDITGDLRQEIVEEETRKDAVKKVKEKTEDKDIIINIDVFQEDDVVHYQHVNDDYEVLIGETDDK